MTGSHHSAPRYAIRIAAQRSGITADTLRAWERRHRAVDPARTGTARRLYSDADIERLRLLREVVDRGHSIGSVAGLPREELLTMLGVDAQAFDARGSSATTAAETAALRDAERSVRSLDAAGLRRVLRRAIMNLEPDRLILSVISPLCRTVGDRWADGVLCTAHEHLASVAIRDALAAIRDELQLGSGGPPMLVATPSGERHELGAMMAAAIAASAGWSPTYLGPDLPARDIASAAIELRAPVVLLSVVRRDGGPRAVAAIARELRELRRSLGEQVTLVVGGPGAAELSAALIEVRAEHIDDLRALRTRLVTLAPLEPALALVHG